MYILKKKKHKKMGPKRASLSIREVYISHLKAKLKAKRGYKKQQHPHLEPNQSKKLIKDNGLSSINNSVQDHKLQTKEFFDLWIESSSFSKVIMFLSFQTLQKYIMELSSMPFCNSCLWRSLANQEESL